MNYSAVAPPSQAGSGDPQSAFADALARARQVYMLHLWEIRLEMGI